MLAREGNRIRRFNESPNDILLEDYRKLRHMSQLAEFLCVRISAAIIPWIMHEKGRKNCAPECLINYAKLRPCAMEISAVSSIPHGAGIQIWPETLKRDVKNCFEDACSNGTHSAIGLDLMGKHLALQLADVTSFLPFQAKQLLISSESNKREMKKALKGFININVPFWWECRDRFTVNVWLSKQ